FNSTYGGGLSGAPLRNDSLLACSAAVDAMNQLAPSHEFHVIRCGGIATADDILASRLVGVMLNQWYVGYFEAFGRVGHNVYGDVVSRMRDKR
ncbi:MAG: hypothetical protein KA339_10045, partial [Candidatus Kapabacteria bacterium]|nr:hypothetical protein [Candidatus Kapabacteria bacterium]